MRPTNRLIKSGAIFFVLWGVLHLAVGLGGGLYYLAHGPLGFVSTFGGSGAPVEPSALVVRGAHLALDFLLLLAGYGLLAVWAAVLVWRGQWLGFWLNAIMLGIADAAFVIALMVPGDVPLSQGVWGPMLYILGVAFTAAGMTRGGNPPA